MKKIFFGLLACLAIVLMPAVALCGCGGKSGEKTETTVEKFKVTFVATDIEYLGVSLVEAGKKVNAPTLPKNSKLKLDGWYTDEAKTKYFDIKKTAIKKNITLYARFYDKNLTMEYEGERAWVKKCNSDAVNVVVPEIFLGLPVDEIGTEAFSGCDKLFGVVIPESVKTIGSRAFYHCESLETVAIPASVENIRYRAFIGCFNLTAVDLAEQGKLKTIADEAFCYCSCLEAIEIPESVTDIVSRVFASCDLLKTAVLPVGLKSIGDSAFAGCRNLTEMTIPAAVENLGSRIFSGCSNLQEVTFAEGFSMKSLNFALAGSSIVSVAIPDSVTRLAKVEFGGCMCLRRVVVSESVQEIEEGAFGECDVIQEITVPFIGTTRTAKNNFWMIFGGNVPTSLETVTILGGGIAHNAFTNCKYIRTIVLPETLPEDFTAIGYSAFYGCENLREIELPSNTTEVGSDAFCGCKMLEAIEIPASVEVLGENAFAYCEALASIVVENGNTVYDSRDNCNAILRGSSLIVGCKNTVIPDGITYIEGYAFRGCTGLTSIAIPDSVVTIPDYAFEGCTGLTSIVIPSGVVNLGNAFLDCFGLESISVAAGNTVYDSRDNCNAIIETQKNVLVIGCKNTVIPNGVDIIGDSAFRNCSGLTSITIPESVTDVGYSAFYECDSLATVAIDSANIYVAANGTGYDNAGNLLKNATTVYVLKTIVDNPDNENSYLNDTDIFEKTDGEGDWADYYAYTRVPA